MREKGVAPILILLLVAVVLLAGYFIQKQGDIVALFSKANRSSVTISGYSGNTPVPVSSPAKSLFNALSENWLEYFKSDVFSKYPDLQNTLNIQDVKRVFPFNVNKGLSAPFDNWLVEVKTQEETNYYLVTPQIKKQLVGWVRTDHQGQNERYCSVEDLFIAGNKETDSKIVLTGWCNTQRGGNFISVYRLGGEKIKLQGAEDIADSNGNALGKVRGIYGESNPTLVVDYGPLYLDKGQDRITGTAYFDLQSGQLQQVVKFN